MLIAKAKTFKSRKERNELLDLIETWAGDCRTIEELEQLKEDIRHHIKRLEEDDKETIQICDNKQQLEQIFLNQIDKILNKGE